VRSLLKKSSAKAGEVRKGRKNHKFEKKEEIAEMIKIKPFDFKKSYQNVIKKIKIDADTHIKLESWFGKYQVEDLIDLAGGLPVENYTDLKITIQNKDNAISISIKFKEMTIHRTLFKEDKLVILKNDYIKVDEANQAIGTKIFANQIVAAQKLGVNKIRALLAKGKLSNGYYTFARFGFELDKDFKEAFKSRVNQSKNKRIQKTNNLNELMNFEEGRKYWLENGFSFFGEFDLSENSESMRIFKTYYQQKIK
jgi:hypothetical protein